MQGNELFWLMDHKELNVWKQSVDFVVDIHGLTAFFLKKEALGLTSQMRRPAISIPSNIAEGASRGSDAEYIHFMNIALGSASKLETQLIISNRLGFVCGISSQSKNLVGIKQQPIGLIRYLQSKKKQPSPLTFHSSPFIILNNQHYGKDKTF